MYIHIVGKGIYLMDKLVIGKDKSGCTLKLWCRNVNVLLVDRQMSKDIANEILDFIAQAIARAQKIPGIIVFDEGVWFAERVKKMAASSTLWKQKEGEPL